ncbi:MAG: dimethyladenosine transferase, rRNA (adenine1518-N6/adenine1519-N6)-dimethyltransferase [Candidatus Parcubacteria bacterium]|jgi:16S rRNA (adenine1518-N6/adenine1519-N6)-dimethyltransferase
MFGKAKKSLGQNFLNSEGALLRMCTAAHVVAGDVVLEIGPGRGALTKKLLATGATVIAVEKDRELIEPLEALFANEIASGKLLLIEGDALTIDVGALLKRAKATTYTLVANIPYYITGALLERYLGTTPRPAHATVLVQKEVAERIVARDGKESILSVAVKAYGTPSYIETVKRGSFTPAPKVDSAILHIAHVTTHAFDTAHISETVFFSVVKAGFAHKRKHLGSNLKGVIAAEKLTNCGIAPERRAETLSVADWFCLASA